MTDPANTSTVSDTTRQVRCGLVNQGATCYLNSLLQLLFHTSYFRSAVFRMATDGDTIADVPKALQNLFFQMQERGADSATTKCLTDAFGWDENEVYVQHDIHELFAKLRDNLESKMKGTPAEGAINSLFTGYSETYFRCLDGSYTSRRREIFYEQHVKVEGFDTMHESLRSMLATEQLTGSNKYKLERDGHEPEYKDAEKGMRFLRFPPVMMFHLMRFEMDLMSPTLEMKKINSAMRFPDDLDLAEFEHGLGPDSDDEKAKEGEDLKRTPTFTTDSAPQYDLYGIIVHRGGVRAGHYICYMRDLNNKDAVAGGAEPEWGDWIEFDDEYTRPVSRETAVTRNFGGVMPIRTATGSVINTTSSQNAYIAVYVRRADIGRVFFRESTEHIPRYVKEQFDRMLAEEREKRRLAELRRKQCVCSFITAAHVEEHVRAHGADLMRGQPPKVPEGTVNKDASFRDVISAAVEATGIDSANMRLWLLDEVAAGRWRVATQRSLERFKDGLLKMPSWDEAAKCTVKSFGEQADERSTLTFYVETPRTVVSHLPTNVAALDEAHLEMSTSDTASFDIVTAVRDNAVASFAADDPRPTFRVGLRKAYPVRRVHFRVLASRGAAFRMEFQVQLSCGGTLVSRKKIEVVSRTSAQLVEFGFDGVEADSVEIVRSHTGATDQLRISRVAVRTKEQVLPTPPPSDAPAFATATKAHYFMFLKYFNPATGRLSFMGTCVVPALEPLAASLPIIRAACGLPDKDTPLALFEERAARDVVALSLEHPPQELASLGVDNTLRPGAIVIVQPAVENVPRCFQHVSADGFLKTLADTRRITLRQHAAPHDVVATVSMVGSWRFGRVVTEIARAVNAPQDYVRFYCPTSVGPRADPEKSHDDRSLTTMTTVRGWATPVLYVEVTQVKRAVLEQQVKLTVVYADEAGVRPDGAEPLKLVFDKADATLHAVVGRVLEENKVAFDRPHALVEVYDHVIRYYHTVDPCPAGSSPPDTAAAVEQLLENAEYRSTFEVRPYTKPPPGKATFAACNGEWAGSAVFFGTPRLVALDEDTTVSAAHAVLVKAYECGDEDLPSQYPLMHISHHRASYFENPDRTRLDTFYRNNPHASVMLSRPRPKERPGSRYVAIPEPKLVLDKKDKKKEDTHADAASPASSVQRSGRLGEEHEMRFA